MRKILFAVLFFWLTAPAIADECPMGYTPTKYTQLEYIESTGTQYIDTGIYWMSGYSSEMDFTSISAKGNFCLWGASNGSSYNTGEVAVFWYDDKFDRISPTSNSTSNNRAFVSYNANTRYLLVYNNDATTAISDMGTMSISNQPFYDSYIGENSVYIMATHRTNAAHNSEIKLHNFKIFDNTNIMVRDFIPAKRVSDGEIGMFDTVTGHFFTNAGTGEFIAGPEILTENTCFPCPPNTYKDFVGNGDCTPCPDTFSSPSGATSINECGRILHIGDYIAHMPFGRRTEHGLCTMFDGKKYCADVYERQ